MKKNNDQTPSITEKAIQKIKKYFKLICLYSKENQGYNNNLDYINYFLLINKQTIIKTLVECHKSNQTFYDFIKNVDLTLPKLIRNSNHEKIKNMITDRLTKEEITKITETKPLKSKNLITITKNQTLKEVTLIDLRNFYGSEILHLEKKHLTLYLEEFQSIKKIILPTDFSFNKYIESKNQGFYSYFFENKYVYELIFKVIRSCLEINNITIIIPELTTEEDYCFWYTTIKTYLGENAKVGLVINSISDLYEIKNLRLIEECFLDLDEMLSKKPQNMKDYNYFNTQIVNELRDIKGVLKDNNIELTLVNKHKTTEEIINKCLRMGVKSYINDVKTALIIKETIKKQLKT